MQTPTTNPAAAIGATRICTVDTYRAHETDQGVNKLLAEGWEILSYQVLPMSTSSSLRFVCTLTHKGDTK